MQKLIGISRKTNIGNYRVERFKSDKYGNIGGIEIGCYVDASHLTNLGDAIRQLNRLGGLIKLQLEDVGCTQVIQYNDLPNKCYTSGSGFANIGIQFKLKELNNKLNENIWNDITKMLIGMLEESKIIILEK